MPNEATTTRALVGSIVIGLGAAITAAIALPIPLGFGWLYWVLGATMGLVAAVLGARGEHTATLLALLSIVVMFAGRSLSSHLTLQRLWGDLCDSTYELTRLRAEAFAKLPVDVEPQLIKEFIAFDDHRPAWEGAAGVTDRDVAAFLRTQAPMLRAFAARRPTLDAWLASTPLGVTGLEKPRLIDSLWPCCSPSWACRPLTRWSSMPAGGPRPCGPLRLPDRRQETNPGRKGYSVYGPARVTTDCGLDGETKDVTLLPPLATLLSPGKAGLGQSLSLTLEGSNGTQVMLFVDTRHEHWTVPGYEGRWLLSLAPIPLNLLPIGESGKLVVTFQVPPAPSLLHAQFFFQGVAFHGAEQSFTPIGDVRVEPPAKG